MSFGDRSPSRAPALMSIGEVLDHLRGEFPDITVSKLRFLESEGLVEPVRTPAGYRKYSPADVARLRYVLTAQRDHYLPLRVIREHLAAIDRGEPVPAPTGALRLPAPGTAPEAEQTHVRLSRADLLDRAGLTDATLSELEQHGLVLARAGGWYDADALTVASVARQLGEYGLEPRHLRPYRTAADREVGMFAQLVAPLAHQSSPEARAKAADTLRELAALSQRLQAALVRARLRATLGQ